MALDGFSSAGSMGTMTGAMDWFETASSSKDGDTPFVGSFASSSAAQSPRSDDGGAGGYLSRCSPTARITRAIVTAHGGKTGVDSAERDVRGFTVSLARAEPARSGVTTPNSSRISPEI